MSTEQVGLSPKLYPAIVAIVTGIVLIVIQVDDTLGTGILLAGIGQLGVGAALSPGQVRRVPPKKREREGNNGYGLVEVIGACFLGVLLVLALVALLNRI